MKKGCLVAVAAAVLLAALVVAFVFWWTGDAVAAADGFLAHLSEGKFEAAYESAAEALRTQQSLEEFTRAVEAMGLMGCGSAVWTSREVQNDQANLEGSLSLKDGGTLPLSMKLVKESGEWRVIAMTTPRAGAVQSSGGGPPSIPADDQLKSLVHGTMTDFSKAVATGDFEPFHSTISARWQAQITAAQLRQVFGQFVDQKVDLSGVPALAPVLTAAPSTSNEGLLLLSGFYPLQPQPLQFELKYLYEYPQWKLFGIHVNLEAPAGPGGDRPSEASPGEPGGANAVTDRPAEDVPAASSADAYEIIENAQLTGRLGRLTVLFPQGSNPSSTRTDGFPTCQDSACAGE